jgi:hypothetical protein
MNMYWAFSVEGIARHCLYLDSVRDTESYHELSRAIVAYRDGLPCKREWGQIPLQRWR